MEFAYFPGCKIDYYLKQYGMSSRAVLSALGVELVDIEFNCCGYPIRHQSFQSSILLAARSIALAQKEKLDIITPCMCCFGHLKYAEQCLKENSSLKEETNSILSNEGLKWEGSIQIKHLLSVLFHNVGLETIRGQIQNPYHGLRVAVHYGCHALRPGNVVRFDNPLAPTLFENLVDVTGAESVDWARRLECCGNPLWEKNNSLSLKLMRKKLEDATQSGAKFLCTACTYCQIQFDTVQEAELLQGRGTDALPSILYPQLLGLSLGLDETALGLEYNKIDIRGIKNYL
ncbi:MAG: disulfide reductase [Deltaproteobacteria bacterium]|nr:MAG: disulfide reductase [Deltaproteobacteria bacterium]